MGKSHTMTRTLLPIAWRQGCTGLHEEPASDDISGDLRSPPILSTGIQPSTNVADVADDNGEGRADGTEATHGTDPLDPEDMPSSIGTCDWAMAE